MLRQVSAVTQSIEMFGFAQLVINAMVQTGSETTHINSLFSLRVIVLELMVMNAQLYL